MQVLRSLAFIYSPKAGSRADWQSGSSVEYLVKKGSKSLFEQGIKKLGRVHRLKEVVRGSG